ncbi:MAG: hypothetical protein ACRC4W_04660, partial [Treponemataceae bacterium]
LFIVTNILESIRGREINHTLWMMRLLTLNQLQKKLFSLFLPGFICSLILFFPQGRLFIVTNILESIRGREINHTLWMMRLLKLAFLTTTICLSYFIYYFKNFLTKIYTQFSRVINTLVFITITTCLFFNLYYGLQIVLYPYQHEVREGAALVVIQNILKGVNPYAFSVQPHNTYVYGILNPLLAVPLTAVMGIGMIPIRLMNLLYIFITAIIIFKHLASIKCSFLLNYVLTCTFFMGMIQKNLCAFPNALGMLLLTSSIIVSHKYNYSYRSLIISGILSILAFYTKPYYMVGIGYICTWLFLFSSYKKSLKVFFIFSIAFLFSLIVTHLFFPSYINNNLFHHTGVASYQVNHMINQVLYFFKSEFILLFLYVIFFTTVSLKEKFYLTVQFKFRTIYNIAIILSFIFFLFKLGGHVGAGGGAYLYDMMYPFLFWQ